MHYIFEFDIMWGLTNVFFGIIGLVSSISSNGTGVTLVSKSSCDICRRIFKLGDEVAVVAAVAVAAPALFLRGFILLIWRMSLVQSCGIKKLVKFINTKYH